MKELSMRTLESAQSGGSLEVGANAEGFHIVDASGGDSVCLDQGQATELLGELCAALGVPRDAEDAYVRGFAKGFDEAIVERDRLRRELEALRDRMRERVSLFDGDVRRSGAELAHEARMVADRLDAILSGGGSS